MSLDSQKVQPIIELLLRIGVPSMEGCDGIVAAVVNVFLKLITVIDSLSYSDVDIDFDIEVVASNGEDFFGLLATLLLNKDSLLLPKKVVENKIEDFLSKRSGSVEQWEELKKAIMNLSGKSQKRSRMMNLLFQLAKQISDKGVCLEQSEAVKLNHEEYAGPTPNALLQKVSEPSEKK